MLERFVLIMSAVDCVCGAGGLFFDLADFAVDLAADGVMQTLVAFMAAMRRDDCVLRAFRLGLYLVGFLVNFLTERDLRDLDADVLRHVGPALRRGN